MILLILSAVIILLFAFIIGKLISISSDKDVVFLSDANYNLNKDIEISRQRALQLKQSLQELNESMNKLKDERDTLLNKQSDLLYFRNENLKKWTDDIKN